MILQELVKHFRFVFCYLPHGNPVVWTHAKEKATRQAGIHRSLESAACVGMLLLMAVSRWIAVITGVVPARSEAVV